LNKHLFQLQNSSFDLNRSSLSRLVNFSLARGLSVALWRLPGKKEPGFLSGKLKTSHKGKLEHPSYIFSSYNTPDIFQIVPSIYAIHGNLFSHLDNNDNREFVKLANSTPGTENQNAGPHWHRYENEKENISENKDHYIQLVDKAISAIRRKKFDKVVLARKRAVHIPTTFCPVDFFLTLALIHSNNFISLVSTPKTGTWVGASPELLLSCHHQNFKTVALAGTRKISGKPLKEGFTEKERFEQSLVAEYIKDVLIGFGSDFKQTPLKVIKADSLFHIKNEFHFRFPENKLIVDLISELHPTPAVCGFPKGPARQFIKGMEGFDRKFFSGFSGPYFNNDLFYLYVNIRCMEILDQQGVLYAGAGITKDSDPEKEWTETDNKMTTISRYL
jgi:isochorismate synthase